MGEHVPPLPKFVAGTRAGRRSRRARAGREALVKAQAPVIVADRMARTPAGMERLVALAEALQIPVIDSVQPDELPDQPPPQRRSTTV